MKFSLRFLLGESKVAENSSTDDQSFSFVLLTGMQVINPAFSVNQFSADDTGGGLGSSAVRGRLIAKDIDSIINEGHLGNLLLRSMIRPRYDR